MIRQAPLARKFLLRLTLGSSAGLSCYFFIPNPIFPEIQPDIGSCVIRIPGATRACLYYPCKPNSKRRPYLDPCTVDVLAKRFYLPSFFIYFLRNAEHQTYDSPPPLKGTYPLVIFSHGLAGTMNIYSTQCAALAARGFVVCALEHEDGSAMHAFTEKGESMPYQDVDSWEDLMVHEKMVPSRAGQLEQRCAEISQALETLPELIKDTPLQSSIIFDKPSLVGHSFGGATAIKYIHEHPNEFANVISWDCWSLCLPDDILETNLPMPVINIASDQFINDCRFCDTFPMTETLFNESNGKIVCLQGSHHVDFSDCCYWWRKPINRFFDIAGFHPQKTLRELIDTTVNHINPAPNTYFESRPSEKHKRTNASYRNDSDFKNFVSLYTLIQEASRMMG